MRTLLVMLGALCVPAVGWMGACASQRAPDEPAAAAVLAPALDTAHLHNVFEVGPGLYSGSGPDGEEAFDELAAMGVRTIVSVDGARPDIERAHERDMRYVHIPIGYDGFDADDARRITLAVRDLPGPVYVHCHHGVHRGPTMAAAAQVGLGRWSREDALSFMEIAGTSHAYEGLFASAAQTQALATTTPALEASELPEAARVTGLVAGMSAIDQTWERLRDIRDAGWSTPEDHPDLVPAAEAGMLADFFRALADDPEVKDASPELREWMEEASDASTALERLLVEKPGPDVSIADARFADLKARCASCHDRFRN